MGRSSAEDTAERLAATAEAMTRLRSPAAVVRQLSARYGVAGRTVCTWIRRVREQRRSEATDVDRDAARDQMRADLNTVVGLALNRTQTVKNEDGSIVLDTNGKPMLRANPDLGRALHAMRELMHLDGLSEPIQATVNVHAKVDQAPQLGGLSDEQLAAGLAFVASLAPDGDMGRLLGEHFRLSGSRPARDTDEPQDAPLPEG